MKKATTYFTFLYLLFANQSCNRNCDGFNRIDELSALTIAAKDTIDFYPRSTSVVFGMGFHINNSYSSKKGDRKCMQKDLVVMTVNGWDSSTLSMKCDKNLYQKSKVFPADTELKGTEIMYLKYEKDFNDGIREASIQIYDIDSITNSADYKFTISQKTTDNKLFSAQKTVFIKK